MASAKTSAPVVKLGGVPTAIAPWIVTDALWAKVEPLLPRQKRRFRYPGRKRLDDRAALRHLGTSFRCVGREVK